MLLATRIKVRPHGVYDTFECCPHALGSTPRRGNTEPARTSRRPLRRRMTLERYLRGIGLAGLALAAGFMTMTAAAQDAAAQDMKSPRISPALVDWEAAGAELGAIEAAQARRYAGRAAREPQSCDRRAVRRYRGKPGAGACYPSTRRLICATAPPPAAQRTPAIPPVRRPLTTSPASRGCRSSTPDPRATTLSSSRARGDARPRHRPFRPDLHSHFRLGATLRARRAGGHDRMAGHRRSRVRLSRDQASLSREPRALHLRALRRALRGVDRMLRRRRALSHDLLPRRRQGRGASHQGAAPGRRHAARSRPTSSSRARSSGPPRSRPSSPITARATCFPAPASRARPASPTTPSIPRSASRWPTRRLSPIRSPS